MPAYRPVPPVIVAAERRPAWMARPDHAAEDAVAVVVGPHGPRRARCRAPSSKPMASTRKPRRRPVAARDRPATPDSRSVTAVRPPSPRGTVSRRPVTPTGWPANDCHCVAGAWRSRVLVRCRAARQRRGEHERHRTARPRVTGFCAPWPSSLTEPPFRPEVSVPSSPAGRAPRRSAPRSACPSRGSARGCPCRSSSPRRRARWSARSRSPD